MTISMRYNGEGYTFYRKPDEIWAYEGWYRDDGKRKPTIFPQAHAAAMKLAELTVADEPFDEAEWIRDLMTNYLRGDVFTTHCAGAPVASTAQLRTMLTTALHEQLATVATASRYEDAILLYLRSRIPSPGGLYPAPTGQALIDHFLACAQSYYDSRQPNDEKLHDIKVILAT